MVLRGTIALFISLWLLVQNRVNIIVYAHEGFSLVLLCILMSTNSISTVTMINSFGLGFQDSWNSVINVAIDRTNWFFSYLTYLSHVSLWLCYWNSLKFVRWVWLIHDLGIICSVRFISWFSSIIWFNICFLGSFIHKM
jgi:hypothetical protein